MKEARTKWKNLKDHFRKEFKKEQGNPTQGISDQNDPLDGVCWTHYNSLMFLKDQFQPKKATDKNTTNEIKTEKIDEFDNKQFGIERIEIKPDVTEDNNTFEELTPKYLIEEHGDLMKTSEKQHSDDNDGKFRRVKLKTLMKSQNKSSSLRGPPKKKLKAFETRNFDSQIEDLKADGADKKTAKGSENYHFVMTLLPHLDRLSSAKRLAVQIKIQQAVFSAIYGGNKSSSESTTSYDSTSSI